MISQDTLLDKDHNNQADGEQIKRTLAAVAGDLQKSTKASRSKIVYDPVLRISKIFAIAEANELPKDAGKEQNGVFSKVKDFILTCNCLSRKQVNEGKFSIKSILFDALKVEQFDWLTRNYNHYQQKQLGQISEKYLTKMKFCLSKLRFDVQSEYANQKTKAQTLQCISQLQKTYDSIDLNKKSKFYFSLNYEKDYIFMLMISAYKVFQKNYCPYKRSKLKDLIKDLGAQTSSFNNSIEVLRFLQNKDPIIAGLKQPLDQLDLNLQVAKGIDQYMFRHQQAQLKTRIALVKVSESLKRRRVINLLISGFLSEDVDKKQQWNQLLACMPDSQVYGLQWESHTINRLVKFLALSIKDLILGKTVDSLLTKDNPFIPAFEVSIQAGQILAYVVHRVFPYQFINIISYSLGSQLIRAFVQKTIQLNGGVNLNKIITMGGVSDVIQFQKTLQKTQNSINVLNVRTKHDSVLKLILKRAKPQVKPLGLNDLPGKVKNHLIKTIDVSKQIGGHFAFMSNFGAVADILMLSQE